MERPEFKLLFQKQRNRWIRGREVKNAQEFVQTLQEFRRKELSALSQEKHAPLRRALARLQNQFNTVSSSILFDHHSGKVTINSALEKRTAQRASKAGLKKSDLLFSDTQEAQPLIEQIVSLLIPWRKGPFNISGMHIEAEWNSYKKWERLKDICSISHLCKGKRILDIGANNFYYDFLMLQQGASEVFAVDPVERYGLYYEFFMTLLANHMPALYYEQLGISELELLGSFDTVFLMGVLYHRRDPLGALEQANKALRKGGTLVLETICLPGTESACLVPYPTYQKSSGYWFIPTTSALEAWVKQSNFEILRVGEAAQTTEAEQRRTKWIRGETLSDFLNLKDPTRTIEGHPAPYRVILLARKKVP